MSPNRVDIAVVKMSLLSTVFLVIRMDMRIAYTFMCITHRVRGSKMSVTYM